MTTVGLLVYVALSLAISTVPFVAGGFEDSLKHWETLSMSKIKRRIVKRDLTSQHPVEQTINFDSYNRHFSLVLRKDFSVLAPGLQILTFEANGSSHELHLDLSIYRGTVQGEKASSVSAYFNDNNGLSASIHTDSELYFIEPAVNLNPNATNGTMIIYRPSDLKWDNNSRCGYVRNIGDKLKPVMNQSQPLLNDTRSSRSKRDESETKYCKDTEKNTCYLFLAAHPKFVKYIGRSDPTETAKQMIFVIDSVDRIYRRHQFDGCDSGFGFEIKRIHIFTNPTYGFPYSSNKEFDFSEFLSTFAQEPFLKEVCLGHIFTYNAFYDAGYVLGLAYVASPEEDSGGGICNEGSNVGWTTYLGSYPLPQLRATLVTAHVVYNRALLNTSHELLLHFQERYNTVRVCYRHNWGSPHDTESAPGCTHLSKDGGNYIMYPISVSGVDPNNDYFSPCSRASIGPAVNAKGSCFKERKKAYCGNYRVDPGEDCDSGFIISSDGDNCCDSTCKLRRTAECSDWNDLCCTNCKISTVAQDITCFLSSDEVCLLDSKCDGRNKSCPLPGTKGNTTRCLNKGLCNNNGECVSLCKSNGLNPCRCDDVKALENACKVCCIGARGCFPYFDTDIGDYVSLSPGSACISGTCQDNGECSAVVRTVMMRLWEILDISTPHAFVQFMRYNIVWTIIILSLIIWIPISCLVCYVDRKTQRERNTIIQEVVEEVLDETGSVSIAPSQTSIKPVGRVEHRHEKMDDVKPDSSQTAIEPVSRDAQEQMYDVKPDSPAPAQPSTGPVGGQPRRASTKEKFKSEVRRLTLEMNPPEQPPSHGKVQSWLEQNPDSDKFQ